MKSKKKKKRKKERKEKETARKKLGPAHSHETLELKSESRPIHGHFTCETRALVYLITCSSCNAVYVGETGQKLRERLNGHRPDIRNGNDTPVGVHFGQPGHELRVSGLELTSKNATSRKVRERSWIDFF